MADSGSSLSPEKRLLNLIESGGKGGAASGGNPGSVENASEMKRAGFSVEQIKSRFGAAVQVTKLFIADAKNKFGLKSATKTARIILVALILVTLFNAVNEMRIAGHDPLEGLDVPEKKVTHIDMDGVAMNSRLVPSAESRNVFLPFAKREEVLSSKPNSHAEKLTEMTKNLKLTGISYNPENIKMAYCMIEDLQKSITLFLHEGDHIGSMQISKINEESVEVKYENEKIEIH